MTINPEMLVVARESRGLTQTALAEKIGVTQSKVSKYEIGSLDVSASDMLKLSKCLDYPPEFFSLRELVYGLADYFYYRKKAALTVSQQKSIEAQANVLRIRVMRLLRGVEMESPNQFPHIDVDSVDDGPAEVARRIRAAWSLPSGPIRSVMGAAEGAGGIILCRPFGTTHVDSVIQCPSGLPPLFLINSSLGSSGERQRYSLAHEIGHVVMRNFMSPDPEGEANRFASEFLMPEREISRDLDDLSLAKAFRLKPYWKVSIQALIRRAYDLKKINERKYRGMFADLSARGFRVNEPNRLPVEQPVLIDELISIHYDRMGFDDITMCRLLISCVRDYESQFRRDPINPKGFGVVG
jgi:Zn-dependent peptidase ImmA (M78 family)/transcriptional regulator with XRE-family HTH domain